MYSDFHEQRPCQLAFLEDHERVHRQDWAPCCRLYAKCYKRYSKTACESAWRAYILASRDWSEYNAYSASVAYILAQNLNATCECYSWLAWELHNTIPRKLREHRAGKGAKDPCRKFFGEDGKPKNTP